MTPILVLDSETGTNSVGPAYRSRKTRPGPEAELIERFLDQQPFKAPRGCRVTVFREPCLESGFPDLVLVIWHVATATKWNTQRAELKAEDLRLMHYLLQTGPTTEPEITTVLGRRAMVSLSRLEAAEMIRRSSGRWWTRPVSKSFAARSIVAVEAKMAQWEAALQQARLNTWFASSSYVLVPQIPKSSNLSERANSIGIGVWTGDTTSIELHDAPPRSLPRSYCSWLFNEWAWRAAFTEP